MTTTRKPSKYEYLVIVQVNYGHHGWEDVDTCESWKEARASLKLYRENEPAYQHPHCEPSRSSYAGR